MVADKVPVLGGDVAVRRPVDSLYFHRVCGIVEIDDMDVEDEHSRARDLVP